MTLVVDKFRTLIPARVKTSPSGWTSFNAPCCHHRGHNPDTKNRGGLRFDHGIVYHCFNCHYTTGWEPGWTLHDKFRQLCKWLGATDHEINALIFEALKTERPDYVPAESNFQISFENKQLPEGSLPLSDWLEVNDSEIQDKVLIVTQYLMCRGFDPLDKNFYWSPEAGYNNRVIIPFRYQRRIVGNTARKITAGNPKYLSDQHPHFVFNVDAQLADQKYLFVCEGPFDALAIGGVALLTNDVADQQARIINGLGHEVVVVPDQDRAGLALIDRAIEQGWSVAFPNWDDDVKDCADAVYRYGKLFVLVDAIQTAQQGEIKITMAKKQLEAKIKRNEKYAS